MNKIRLAYSVSVILHIVGIVALVILLAPLNKRPDTPLGEASITYLIAKPSIKEILPNMGVEQQPIPPLRISTNNTLTSNNHAPISTVTSNFTAPSTLVSITPDRTQTLEYPPIVGNILPRTLLLDRGSIDITFQTNPRLLVGFDSVQSVIDSYGKGRIAAYLQRLARLIVGGIGKSTQGDEPKAASLTAYILVDRSGRVYSTNFIQRGFPLQEQIVAEVIQSLRFNAATKNQVSSAIITVLVPM